MVVHISPNQTLKLKKTKDIVLSNSSLNCSCGGGHMWRRTHTAHSYLLCVTAASGQGES